MRFVWKASQVVGFILIIGLLINILPFDSPQVQVLLNSFFIAGIIGFGICEIYNHYVMSRRNTKLTRFGYIMIIAVFASCAGVYYYTSLPLYMK